MKDVGVARNQVVVCGAKRNKDRQTMRPQRGWNLLETPLTTVKQLHASNLTRGLVTIDLPKAFAEKNPPAAWAWKFEYRRPGRKVSRLWKADSVPVGSGVMPQHARRT